MKRTGDYMFSKTEIEEYLNLGIYKRSERLVKILFKDKCDKSNTNYLNHLHHVSEDFKDSRKKAMALMHDVLEDTDVTSDDLLKLGYDKEFILVLEILTHRDGSYSEYIDKIINSKNKDAIEIKMKDLLHNMDLTRIKNITEKDIKRCKKYIDAYLKLIKYMEGDY